MGAGGTERIGEFAVPVFHEPVFEQYPDPSAVLVRDPLLNLPRPEPSLA